MVSVVLTVTAFAGLVTLATSFNSNRTGDEFEDGINNIDRWYIVFEDYVTEKGSTSSIRTAAPTSTTTNSVVSDPDPLSVIWYLGAFGGLIAFLLVVTFSEWCCASKHLYRRHALAATYLTGYSTESRTPETPPPPYHLFAPPPYSEVTCFEKVPTTQAPIFIIPVHQTSPTLPVSPTSTILPTQN